MSLDTALYTYVVGHDLLIPLLHGRVYPLLAPTQAVMPYLLYAEVGYEGTNDLHGAGELALASYQWDVYGRTHREVRDIAEAFRLAMDGFRGIQAGCAIRRVLVRGRSTGLEDDLAGGQQMDYRVTTETDVWHMRPVTVFA